MTTDADITIYIEGTPESYRVRYEVVTSSTLSNSILNEILQRMRKSFSLGNTVPDAYTIPGILRKAELMKTIFRNEYGLSSIIVRLIPE